MSRDVGTGWGEQPQQISRRLTLHQIVPPKKEKYYTVSLHIYDIMPYKQHHYFNSKIIPDHSENNT